MNKRIITISRQFGSGGHSIGKALAERLRIPFYDREILDKISAETGYTQEYIKKFDEYSNAGNGIIWNMNITGRSSVIPDTNPYDTIYFAQAKTIREIAEKESCVIIGRCSDYILKDRDDCLHVFICSDKHNRAKRILENYGDNGKPIEKRIDDMDARRKLYYSHYTDRIWGSPENYHIMLNSGMLSEEECVDSIINLFK